MESTNIRDVLTSFRPSLEFLAISSCDGLIKKALNSSKPRFNKSDTPQDAPKTKRELRIQSKELAEARKKKRKPHYTHEQELALLWEKMRHRDIAKEDRSKLVSEALRKMKGKIHEIAGSHVSCRVLQTCAKYCTQDERNAVFEELRPHFLTLACNTYAVHLITKLLDNASKEQLGDFISSLYGHVASLLRHMVGSVVVEHAYHLGNANKKQSLLKGIILHRASVVQGIYPLCFNQSLRKGLWITLSCTRHLWST